MRYLSFAPLLLVLALAACGGHSEEVEPVKWPFLEAETPAELSINGQAFKAFIASTEAHRKRALHGLALGEKQAIAYLFPKLDEAAEIKFRNLPDPADLVFIDAAGKVIAVEKVAAFSYGTFPRTYAHEGARVVLQLARGAAETLKLAKGSAMETNPDLVKKSDDAEALFARLYFIKSGEKEDDKPEDSPYVSLKVLEKAEDCAQALKDRPELKEGQGVIFPVSSYHQFWLKGVEGKVCACYIEQARGSGTVIAAMYEGIEDTGKTDNERPVYYAPQSVNYLALWKGSDTFTKHKVDRRSRVVPAGVEISSEDKADWDDIGVKFGDTRLSARLAQTQSKRETAIIEAPTLKDGKAVILAWDDAADVKIENAPAGANLWFVNHTSGNKYSISEKVKTTGGEVKAAAKSRFVIAVPPAFETSAELDLPWLIRDLMPSLPAIAFYNAKQKDVVKDRWPGEKDNLRKLARVELALTDAEQQRGLMYRTSLKPDHGMLFIYKSEQEMSFWMKNCKMNIAIAFANERGEIIKIHASMKAPVPGTPDHQLENYKSDGLAKYAIEMEEDWFAKNGIKEGDRVFIPPELAAYK